MSPESPEVRESVPLERVEMSKDQRLKTGCIKKAIVLSIRVSNAEEISFVESESPEVRKSVPLECGEMSKEKGLKNKELGLIRNAC